MAASGKGSINSNKTIRRLSKIWLFLYRRAVFLVKLIFVAKKLRSHANFRLVYQTR